MEVQEVWDTDLQEKSYEDFGRIAEELRAIALENKVTIITATQMKPPDRSYRFYDYRLSQSIAEEAQIIMIDYIGLLK